MADARVSSHYTSRALLVERGHNSARRAVPARRITHHSSKSSIAVSATATDWARIVNCRCAAFKTAMHMQVTVRVSMVRVCASPRVHTSISMPTARPTSMHSAACRLPTTRAIYFVTDTGRVYATGRVSIRATVPTVTRVRFVRFNRVHRVAGMVSVTPKPWPLRVVPAMHTGDMTTAALNATPPPRP